MRSINGSWLKTKTLAMFSRRGDNVVIDVKAEAHSEAKADALTPQAPSVGPSWHPVVWNGQEADDQSLIGLAEPDVSSHAWHFVAWLQSNGFGGSEVATQDLQALYGEFCVSFNLTPRGWSGRGVGSAVGQLCGGQRPKRLIVAGCKRQAKVYRIPWASNWKARRRA